MIAVDQAKRAGASAAQPAKKTAAKSAVKPVVKRSVAAVRKPKAQQAAEASMPALADKAGKPAKPAKPREKLVRDSFTMPQTDYARIAALKARALQAQRPTKKSELLRAGLHVLEGLALAELVKVLNRLVSLRPGRPKKSR